jgi:hypothetical protein
MTLAILSAMGPLIAALAPILAQWIVRRWAAKQDPKNQLQEQKNENGQVVAGNDSNALNTLFDERINRVRPAPPQGSGPAR